MGKRYQVEGLKIEGTNRLKASRRTKMEPELTSSQTGERSTPYARSPAKLKLAEEQRQHPSNINNDKTIHKDVFLGTAKRRIGIVRGVETSSTNEFTAVFVSCSIPR